jgi:copper(I)-binding protein
MRLRTIIVLAAAAAATGSWAQSPGRVEVGSLTVSDAWSRATPGGARVGAGYLAVENRGPEPDRLVSAEAEVSAGGELHETVMEAGVARMKPTGALAIAPNGRLELKPGGYHLMLSGLKRPLKEGELFAATLVFEKAGRVPVTFVVRGIGAGAETQHHH